LDLGGIGMGVSDFGGVGTNKGSIARLDGVLDSSSGDVRIMSACGMLWGDSMMVVDGALGSLRDGIREVSVGRFTELNELFVL
jgi:hypothetical protein